MFARLSLAFAGAAALLATPAVAQSEAVSVTVSASGLDLATDGGRAQLDRRIRQAADKVCNSRSGGLSAMMNFAACRETALEAASRDAARLAARNGDTIRLARNAR